jgi:hypothetical protein
MSQSTFLCQEKYYKQQIASLKSFAVQKSQKVTVGQVMPLKV